MAFDFKKECKELYKPASKPSIVTVPPMSYVAVRGKGDPNTEGGEYQNALPLLYGIAYVRKDDFNFISCIRLPDFVNRDDFDWAVAEATTKKKLDFSAVELLKVDEGLCVQCMHTGPYDSEPATVNAMHEYTAEQGYVPDFSDTRLHHEIYLSDPRKCAPEKLKTVVRHPIKRAE